MFVYCKDYHNRVRCFPDVGLHDGSIPRIRQGTIETSTGKEADNSVEMSLEPAIWFKVLILDSISIDCAKRKILWTTCSQCRLTGQDREWGFVYCAHVRQLFHTDVGCYDYDADLDDIFDIATSLLTDSPDNSSLLRLLHCYILPMISLTAEDLKYTKEALKQQIHSIQILDQRLNGQINQMTKMKEYLLQKAKEFTAFLKGKDEVAYKTNREFLKVLLGFLPGIEDENRDNLILCQDKVQEAKTQIENCDENAALNLDNARHHRDEAHKDLQEILTFRECITNLVLIERDDWYELKSAEEEYLTRQDELDELKKEAQLTAEKKKRAVSVREAMTDAIEDLRQGKETVGLDFSLLNGERATDVLNRSSVPNQWQSLSERIGVMANSTNHPLGQMHLSFCNHVITLCRTSLEEDERLKSESSSNLSTISKSSSGTSVTSMEQQSQNRKSKKKAGKKSQAKKETELKDHNTNPLKVITEQLSVEIQDHYKNVTNLIQREEGNFDTMFERKIWRCYEPYFYERTMDDIILLYERANVLDQCSLKQNLPLITLKDLEINEEWILELLTHPLVLEDGGFVDVSSSIASAPHSLQSHDNMDRTLASSEHVQNSDLQTEHVQKSDLQTEHDQSTNMQIALEQTTLQGEQNQVLDSKHFQEHKMSSEHCRQTVSTTEHRECFSTSSEEDVLSSSSNEWHSTPKCLTDLSQLATVVERKADTLDRQRKGQRQISIHLPDEEADLAMELLEKLQFHVAGDETSNNDNVVQQNVQNSVCLGTDTDKVCDNVVKPNFQDSVCLRRETDKISDSVGEQNFQDSVCLETDTDKICDNGLKQNLQDFVCLGTESDKICDTDTSCSQITSKEEQTVTDNSDINISVNPTFADNDSLYSQDSNSSQDTIASPLESSDEVFWMAEDTENNSISQSKPWIYTHLAPDTNIFIQPAHYLRQQNTNFVENFRQTFDCISSITNESSLMKKLQWMTKCLQQLNTTMADIFNQKCAENPKFKAVTGDDLPTILILLLMHAPPDDVVALLPQLRLMFDLVAPFVENGCHGYSLTQFQVVYGFLLKKMKHSMDLQRISYTTSV